MDNQITVATLLAQLPQAVAQSSIWKRKAQSWIFLGATGISFVTAIVGFVDAFQHPEKQIIAVGLLAVVIVIVVIQLIRAQIVRRKQHQIVHITPITSIMIDAELRQQLTRQSPLSARQIWFSRCVRIIDNIGWVLLAMVLIVAAGAVFVFSIFGLYEAIRTEVSIFDVVLLIGLVRPLNSTFNGIKKLQQKKIGTRRRMGTFSKSLHYVIESVNHFVERLHLSTTEVLRTGTTVVSHVGGSITTTVSTVALSVTVSGMGLASAHVAPSAVIATGQVIPLPPVIANMAGPAGHEVAVRGAVFYGCMGNILDGNQQSADENCQQAVQQANDSCAGWQGGQLPPDCAQAIKQVLPQAVERIEGTVPQPPAEGPNGNPPPADGNRSLPNNPPPLNGTPQPQDPNQPGNPQPNGAPAPCVAQDPHMPCPPAQAPANPATNNNGYPPPSNSGAPNATPGANGPPNGQENLPPPPQATNAPPPPPQATDAPPPPPQATDAPPPPPQATDVPPQATNVPPQATDVPPQATNAPPPPQATAKPQPTTKPPPPPPPPRP